MSFIDSRKPWCTQRLCQLSLTKLTLVLRGLEQYGFPTAGEIENCAYNQGYNADTYTKLVAKAIYDILQLKKNIHNIDKDQLIKFFDELRYGKKDEGPDGLYYDRSAYDEDDDLYFDRSKYGPGQKKTVNKVKVMEQVPDANHVTFEMDKETKNDDDEVGSTASASTSSSSHDSELAQLNEAINYIKNKDFNADKLITKLKTKYSNEAKLSHKVKMKVHCLLELLEDFDCYDELLEQAL